MCKCNNCNNAREEPQNNMLEIGLLEIPENLYRAICVMNGRYSAGTERKEALGNAYETVQKIVNEIAQYWDK